MMRSTRSGESHCTLPWTWTDVCGYRDEDEMDREVERSLKGGLNDVMDQDWDVVSGGAYHLIQHIRPPS